MDSESHFVLSLYQSGNYTAVLATDDSTPFLQILKARSSLALSPPNPKQARSFLEGIDSLNAKALREFSLFLEGGGMEGENLDNLEEMMLEMEGEDGSDDGGLVKSILATALIIAGIRLDECAEILLEGIGNKDQDCLGVLTHLYNSIALSSKANSLLTSPSTTSFTADSIYSQLLLAQTYLHSGPTINYQKAYYAFDELKSSQAGRSPGILNGVGVSQAVLGRWDEALAAILEGKAVDEKDGNTLANEVVLGLHCGQSLAVTETNYLKLKATVPDHKLVRDVERMSSEFDSAATKFSIAA